MKNLKTATKNLPSRKKPETVVAALKAIRALVNRGWAQGTERRKNKEKNKYEYCLIGAARAVDGPCEPEAARLLYRSMPGKFKAKGANAWSERVHSWCARDYYQYIPDFNDSAGTTKERVLGVIDKALVNASKTHRK